MSATTEKIAAIDAAAERPALWRYAAVVGQLLLATLVVGAPGYYFWRRQRDAEVRRKKQRVVEARDTVADWMPTATRILSATERQAYDVLCQALPEHLVLAQVPLSRFIRVPTRYSYGEWLSRVGQLSADLLVCDANSQVLAVVEVRGHDVLERHEPRRTDRDEPVEDRRHLHPREAPLPGLRVADDEPQVERQAGDVRERQARAHRQRREHRQRLPLEAVVAITGQVPQAMIGRGAFQETDVFGLTMPIVKHSYLVSSVEEIPRVIQEAFHIAATGRPGPVVVDIPKNIQQGRCRPSFRPHPAHSLPRP